MKGAPNVVALVDISQLNPPGARDVALDCEVAFVPMSAVLVDSAIVTETEVRRYGEVRKAYTNFDDGDILVAKITPCFENGKIALAKLQHRTAFGSTEFHVVRPDLSRVDAKYLVHFLRQDRIRVAGKPRMTGSGGQRRVPENFLASLRVPLPSLAEQRRIAAILDQADALRAKRREAIAKLDALVQEIFLEMFGDPATNPRGWPKMRLFDLVAELQGGRSIDPSPDSTTESTYRVLKISAVTSMHYRPLESKPVPNDYVPPATHLVRRGDLLFSRANTDELVGAVALVEDTPDNMLLPDKLWRFIWRDSQQVESLFIWALLQLPSLRHEIKRRASGTSGSMKNISQAKLLGIEVMLPPVIEQRRFADRVRTLGQLKSAQVRSQVGIEGLFAVLRDGAFSGEISI